MHIENIVEEKFCYLLLDLLFKQGPDFQFEISDYSR